MYPQAKDNLVESIGQIKKEKELFIVEQLAQLKSVGEITSAYVEKFPDRKPLNPALIYYYRTSRRGAIEQMRAKFLEEATHIPIANEQTRLKRAERLFILSETILKPENRIDAALECLKYAKDETKGERGGNQYLQFNQFNNLSDRELLEKQKDLENKIVNLSKKGDGSYGQGESVEGRNGAGENAQSDVGVQA